MQYDKQKKLNFKPLVNDKLGTMAIINNNMDMIMHRDIFGQRIIQATPKQAPKKQESKVEAVELEVKVKVVKKIKGTKETMEITETKKVKQTKESKKIKDKKEAGTCKAILQSGVNAGYCCSNKIAKGNKKYCGMHSEK